MIQQVDLRFLLLYNYIYFYRYLETVFKSQACINASFLLTDKHYGCSLKNHGIDIEHATKLFGIISELQNNTIQELVRYTQYLNLDRHLYEDYHNSAISDIHVHNRELDTLACHVAARCGNAENIFNVAIISRIYKFLQLQESSGTIF
jgi:hypothetical protein